MRTKNPRFNRFAPIVCGVLGVPPPHTSGFLIVNVEYLRFAIGAPLTFFRADSVTLNTPHTKGKSDKIIFRTTKIIGTLGLSEGEKSAQNQPDYLVVCTRGLLPDPSPTGPEILSGFGFGLMFNG